MGWSYGSDQAIFEKPLFSVRLAEVAIFYLEISTSKTTDLPNYWVNWSFRLVFTPLKKCGIHAKKKGWKSCSKVKIKWLALNWCVSTLHHFWNLENSRASLWKMISSKFSLFFLQYTRISMWVKSISRREPLAYHGPLFKRKDPLRLGLVCLLLVEKLNLATHHHRVPVPKSHMFSSQILMVSSVICKNSTRKTTTTTLCVTWLDNPRMKIYSSP